MASILLIALQILYLLLKAHFDRSDDQRVALESVKEAQKKLAEAAERFELRIRFEQPSPEEVNALQDQMDAHLKSNTEERNDQTSHN